MRAVTAESGAAIACAPRRVTTAIRRPVLRRLVPSDTAPSVAPDDVYRHLDLPAGADGRPYVVVNMVSTVDGKAARAIGISGSLCPRLPADVNRIRTESAPYDEPASARQLSAAALTQVRSG